MTKVVRIEAEKRSKEKEGTITSQPKTHNSMDEVIACVINQLPKGMKDRVGTQTKSTTIISRRCSRSDAFCVGGLVTQHIATAVERPSR